MAKVSILVPVYGVEKFIEKCAISLFEQTFDDIEYIFVNDQTKDNSIEILKDLILKYPKRKSQIKIINHFVNRGLAAARNTGVENAKGDYILHVDSDDYLEKNAIELLYCKAVEENADIVVCNMMFVWDNEEKVSVQEVGDSKHQFIKLMLSAKTMVGIVNKMIRRNIYLDNDIRTFEGINLGEDFVTSPRLAYFCNKISKVDNPLYYYLQTNSNSYTKKVSEANIDNLVAVYSELELFFKDKPLSAEYFAAMRESKVIKKIEFLLQSNAENFNKILTLFPETNMVRNLSFLNKRGKIVFLLIKIGNKTLLKLFIKLYKNFFLLIQKMKGR
jgi:glycosyltransferase involved in cell wall biosynthesis